jgi:hypothetical protein
MNGFVKTSGIVSVFLFALIFAIAIDALADDILQPIATIPVARDSSKIANVASIDDFNNDGYPDLAIAIRQTSPWGWPYIYEAVKLYWGGPTFDSIPDLILGGEPQNFPPDPGNTKTLFGKQISGIGDFNGDGYNDLAVSAPNYAYGTIHQGRLYIYFGSTSPDTIPDMVIAGARYGEYFGNSILAGDYNGDGLGDILTATIGEFYGAQVFIYQGANPPDAIYDWLYDYTNQPVGIGDVYGGLDINGDRYADFSWSYDVDTLSISLLFFGSDSLEHINTPDTISDGIIIFPGDISGDGANDFIIDINDGPNLFLGGPSFDLSPDYFLGYGFRYISPGEFKSYNTDGRHMIIFDQTHFGFRRLELYDTGTPPDTVPCVTLDYSTHYFIPQINIGDINTDGIDEIAFEDTALTQVILYAIHSTGIDDGPGPLPKYIGQFSAYPNPFNSTTTLFLSNNETVPISIYDITGRLVTILKAEEGKAIWDAIGISSGIYFAKIQSDNISKSIKLLLLK